jgi:ribosomal protein S20
MQRRSLMITAALVAGLGLGAAFGPQLRGVSVSAQTQTPTQTPAPVQPQAPAQGQSAAPSNGLWTQFLDNLAAALNIQRSQLDSAITSAGSTTADQAVQQGTLTQAQADALKARIQAGDLHALLGGRGGKGGGPRVAGVQQAMLDAAAQTLGITADELRTQLRSGQTLAQLAQAHNTTEQAVTSAALAAAKTQLDQAVANGTLTQAQADSFYAQLQQQGAQLLTPHGGKGGRGRGMPEGSTTPETPASPAPSATQG